MDTSSSQDQHRAHALKKPSVYKRVARQYLRPFAFLIFLAMLANIIVATTTGSMPWVIQQTVDQVFIDKNQQVLLLLAGVVVVVTFIKAVATYSSSVIMNYIGQKTVAKIQKELFSRLVWADYGYIKDIHSGQLISIFMNDANRIKDSMSGAIVNFVRDTLTVVGLIAAMYFMDWRMALIATVVAPAGIILIRNLSRRTRRATGHGLEESGNLASRISEMLRGIRTVKIYRQEKEEIQRTSSVIDRIVKFTMKTARARASASPGTEALTGIGLAGVIYYAGMQNFAGLLTQGEFVGFTTALLLAYQPLKSVASLQTVLQEGKVAALRIFRLLDHPSSVMSSANAVPIKLANSKVELANVSFSYGDNIPAVKNINLEITPGKMVALVGPSGSGKSTLLNLVPRFYDVQSGAVTLDGQDVRAVSLESLRDAMTLVTQEPFLFDDTIISNIAYSKPDASKQQVKNAARQALAHDFIEALPHGYHTKVGEGGVRLSGGQRQRIAIARAILKNAPILLLDEATSSLDSFSERLVQDALRGLMKKRTTLVITHRLSTVVDAHLIYALEDGVIKEQGTHEQLMANKGLYYKLFQHQSKSSVEGKKSWLRQPLKARHGDSASLHSLEKKDGGARGVTTSKMVAVAGNAGKFLRRQYLRGVVKTTKWTHIHQGDGEDIFQKDRPCIITGDEAHGVLYDMVSGTQGGKPAVRDSGQLTAMQKILAGGGRVFVPFQGSKQPSCAPQNGEHKDSVPQDGGEYLVRLASLAKVPVVPVVIKTAPALPVKMWKAAVGLPFARGLVLWGKPVTVEDKGQGLQKASQQLRAQLTAMAKKAEDFLHPADKNSLP